MYEANIEKKQVGATKINRMSSRFTCNGFIMAMPMYLAILAVLIQLSGNSLADCQEQLTVESRQQKDKDLTETIDYLEKLDEYFSQIARPRFGRSGDFKSKPVMSRFGSQPVRGSPGGGEPALWLIELMNNRLAKKYRDSINY